MWEKQPLHKAAITSYPCLAAFKVEVVQYYIASLKLLLEPWAKMEAADLGSRC